MVKKTLKDLGFFVILFFLILGLVTFFLGVLILSVNVVYGEGTFTVSEDLLVILTLMGNGATLTMFAAFLLTRYSDHK